MAPRLCQPIASDWSTVTGLPLAFTTIRFCALNHGRRERRRRRREESIVYLEDYRDSWFDPGLGVKGRVPFGATRFYFEGGAGIGGFGVGSDLFYEINASVGYQWTKSIGTTIGYRMFDVDYEDNGFVYDVRQQGLQLGLTWSF